MLTSRPDLSRGPGTLVLSVTFREDCELDRAVIGVERDPYRQDRDTSYRKGSSL